MCHGTLQTVLEKKALVMDSPMPHNFLHQIVCDVVDKSIQLIKESVCDSYEGNMP